MNTDEIVTMCEKLARRYRRNDIKKDLVSEGVLAVYERLEVKPEEHPASLYRRANRAMHDYINIKSKPVNIPRSNSARGVSRGKDYKQGSYSEGGMKSLEDALNSVSVSSEDSFTLSTVDCSLGYEAREFLTKAMDLLDEKERVVIHQLYFLELSQERVSQLQGVTQQTISNWELEAIFKMSQL